ncbi:toxic anion resistance protein [Lysobacter capsici]|uniref:toxic anion resistance protein n=1 Tax=Lysobacter capsici TaxID=435897 RepID=UPI000699A1B5|nr:toxic anion resistance protein [Lysobacter capsici]ALN88821.1 toxic anion resistance family protein [Lysobacter capsici]UOF14942.1 toxic anion resistance protein [Lysobacter capsici]
MTMQTSSQPAAETSVLTLDMPEPAAIVREPDQASAMIPFKDELRTQLLSQADGFIQDLLTLDPHSEDFRSRVDSAFRLGRKEIGDSTLLTNKFLDKSFVKDADSPAFKVMSEMRMLFEDLNPSKEGDLLGVHKLLGLIPFGNKLRAYLLRFDAAGDSIRKTIDHLYGVQDELARDDQALYATMQKLLEALTRLKAADMFANELDAKLSAAIDGLKATDPARAKAVEQEVLFYVRQASQDIKTQILVCINGYKMLEGLRKTGRELRNGCDRMATIGMSSLSIAVTLARAQGYQIKVMDALASSSKAIEGLIASTSTQFGQHVDRVAEFQSNPLIGVQALQTAFDTTFAALDRMDEFRGKAIQTMGVNIGNLKTLIDKGEARMNREGTAIAAMQHATAAPAGPVAL